MTDGEATTAVASDFTQSGSAPGSTTLVPLLLTKSEPSPEGELPRGVHVATAAGTAAPVMRTAT